MLSRALRHLQETGNVLRRCRNQPLARSSKVYDSSPWSVPKMVRVCGPKVAHPPHRRGCKATATDSL